jgi:hypothetical protein
LRAITLAEPELMIDNSQDARVCLRLRRALALPIYTIALIFDFASAALGSLAAKNAGDADG